LPIDGICLQEGSGVSIEKSLAAHDSKLAADQGLLLLNIIMVFALQRVLVFQMVNRSQLTSLRWRFNDHQISRP
jgi:hypothetical protein